jgi:hypothetical protein
MDRRKSGCTTSRPAVFTQKRSKVCPCFAFAPSVPQSTGPTASGLEVCGRGRIEDHSDGVSAFLGAEPEQFGNPCSRLFCLFGSTQSNVELEHGSEIVVEREAAS